MHGFPKSSLDSVNVPLVERSVKSGALTPIDNAIMYFSLSSKFAKNIKSLILTNVNVTNCFEESIFRHSHSQYPVFMNSADVLFLILVGGFINLLV